jgi:predicted nucleic acid-binding protein
MYLPELTRRSTKPFIFQQLVLRFGIAVLLDGKQRDMLHSRLERRVLPLFSGRILPFDDPASQCYATLRARACTTRQSIAPADGYIAAITVAHGFAIASRDTSPFEAAGLTVINPWARQGD